MKSILAGKYLHPQEFQQLFLPTNTTAPPTFSPRNDDDASKKTTPHLAVSTNWLSFFRKAKQNYLDNQEELHQSSTNHLYDNHRERVQKKWWNDKKLKKSTALKTTPTPPPPPLPPPPPTASSKKKSVQDTERKELEASLSAQFDEELARTSARFYPAMPVRTCTIAVEDAVEDVETKTTEATKAKEITTTTTTTQERKKSTVHSKGGGAFQSTELSKRYEQIVWGNVFDARCTADCLFVRSALIRKDLLHTFDPQADIVPKTYVVQSVQDVIDAVGQSISERSGSNGSCHDIWVIKPPDSSNAIGVSFFSTINVEQISMSLFPSNTPSATKYVLQKYVAPYLTRTVNMRKFHLRQMMLVVGGSMNAMDIWTYDDVRVLVATNEWSPTDWDDRYQHITNGSVNRGAAGYEEGEQNLSMEQVWSSDDAGRKKLAAIRAQMTTDLIVLMKAVHCNAKKSTCMTLPGTYELFGVDWAVDDTGKGWVLEMNPEPSMKVYPHLKGGRVEMLRGGPFALDEMGEKSKQVGMYLPESWKKLWSSQMMDAMKRLRRNR